MSDISQTVIRLVQQYLVEQGFEETWKCFHKESQTGNEPPLAEMVKSSLVDIIRDGIWYQDKLAAVQSKQLLSFQTPWFPQQGLKVLEAVTPENKTLKKNLFMEKVNGGPVKPPSTSCTNVVPNAVTKSHATCIEQSSQPEVTPPASSAAFISTDKNAEYTRKPDSKLNFEDFRNHKKHKPPSVPHLFSTDTSVPPGFQPLTVQRPRTTFDHPLNEHLDEPFTDLPNKISKQKLMLGWAFSYEILMSFIN